VPALLAGSDGWRDPLSPFAVAAWALGLMAYLHVLFSLHDWKGRDADGRRTQTVLRRAVRTGRRTWAVADGEVVRVYALAGRRHGGRRLKVDVLGAVEFHAETQADEAHAYATELEQSPQPDATAVTLARVLNSPR
jgi:hypothetical protein